MIRGGVGGAKTLTGLKFESRVDLKEVIKKIPGYTMTGTEVFFLGSKVAELYKKHALYKNLLKPQGIDYRTIISKKLLPDDAIYISNGKELFIVEIKFQAVSGSVDEKLQTCDFKNRQYRKLFDPLGISVKYVYVLNKWFEKPEYKDVLEYVKSVGCYYFFYTIPFDFLGLPKPA